MALRAIIKLDTLAETEAIIAFCHTLNLPLDLVPLLGKARALKEPSPKKFSSAGVLNANFMSAKDKRARKAERFSVGAKPTVPLRPEHVKVFAIAKELIKKAGGSIARGDLVVQLAKDGRKPNKVMGAKVSAWIREGSLVPNGAL
jgi:hypothetical protein